MYLYRVIAANNGQIRAIFPVWTIAYFGPFTGSFNSADNGPVRLLTEFNRITELKSFVVLTYSLIMQVQVLL